ncbi:MAG TPA: family 1 glycosylhydrolase [Candidatus Saccharimonadales bacterium]|nr:family 1 glycosylhydrolase [Candidatus Saccharimonadales bacterium]
MPDAKLPKDFLWGASMSAYQSEGGVHTQWTEWECAHAAELAKTAPARYSYLPNWAEIQAQATDPQNYICGKGVEHYERYAEDFKLLQQLHLNAFRFGIEWARLEPREGEWNTAAIEHYRRYIAALREKGIEPILTLWHWTMPVWFTAKGAFERRANLRYWRRFVETVCEELGADVTYVLTLNEPNVYASISYIEGRWPPQQHNPLRGFLVYGNLVRAHKQAYDIWKARWPQARVSLAAHLADTRPTAPYNPINRFVVRIADYAWNWWYLERVRRKLDFIGLNYYFTQFISWRGKLRNPPEPLNDMGWYMEPRDIERLLRSVWQRYRLPIIVTENGLADARDTHRAWWISETLDALQVAIKNGVQLEGYLHWSLLDNFEWSDGWWPHFGLVAVDRRTMQRSIRPSARKFAKQIERLSE